MIDPVYEPNVFKDHFGDWTYVGDHVAYATREGDSAVLRSGRVTAIKGTNKNLKVQISVNGRKRWVENLLNIVRLEG